jgi:nitrilase
VLVAFPENFSLFTNDPKQHLEEAESMRGPTVQTLQEWAAEYGIWILGGSIPIKARPSEKKATNTSVLVSPVGDLLARYDKIHLFDVQVEGDQTYSESDLSKPGKVAVTADLPFGKVGLSICYDLRFPELFRKYARQDAKLLFIPSAFTEKTGKAHWDVLTRARAIENLAYVIAPAQTGSPYPGRVTHGHTRIIDPWGKIIAERPAGAGVVWADLNFERLDEIRRDFPALTHQKL